MEIVPHPGTDAAVTERVVSFLRELGQKPVRLHIETPGFVVNRLTAALFAEANSLVARGVISVADLDEAVREGTGPHLVLLGMYTSLSLSGGGGPDGFERAYTHLGPAAEYWRQDMEKHRWEDTKENRKLVIAKVAEMFQEGSDTLSAQVMASLASFTDLIELKRRNGAL